MRAPRRAGARPHPGPPRRRDLVAGVIANPVAKFPLMARIVCPLPHRAQHRPCRLCICGASRAPPGRLIRHWRPPIMRLMRRGCGGDGKDREE
ncbi:MAG: hypothetical protein OXU61_03430 [Gammaproteobacteria bacterium]|nr:hypothetical protein [Gammaproteobacteria bacterium]